MSAALERIKKLSQSESTLMAGGFCPECEVAIRGYKPAFGSFAPEIWATLREHGIDPATGHRQSCSFKELKL